MTDVCSMCHQRPRRAAGGPLCLGCHARVGVVLVEAPGLYVQGTQALGVSMHAMSDKLSTPRPGSRSPLADGVLELCDDLARGLWAWESVTVAHAGLTPPAGPVRPGFAVQRAATTLARHLTASLAPPYGIAHARYVLTLTGALRDRLGLTALVHNLTAPCPHCDTRALVRRNGDDHVSCRLCGSAWPEHHYALLVRMLVAESTNVE
jgi:ribosomal protein L37AE/L43A